MPKIWEGSEPVKCQVCLGPITDTFVDGRINETWAMMCPTCHKITGGNLGTGYGQKYEKQGEQFVKIAG